MSRGVRRPLGAATALVMVLLVVGGSAATAAPGGAPSCPQRTLKQDAAAADTVFRGVVSRVGATHTSGKLRFRTYRVSADRTYQGTLVTRSPVVTGRLSGGGCVLPPLVKGRRYIVFGHESGGRLVAGAGTARATHALTHQVVKLLGNGQQQTPPPPAAVLTRVSQTSAPTLSRLLAPGVALAIVGLLGLLVVGRLGRQAH